MQYNRVSFIYFNFLSHDANFSLLSNHIVGFLIKCSVSFEIADQNKTYFSICGPSVMGTMTSGKEETQINFKFRITPLGFFSSLRFFS